MSAAARLPETDALIHPVYARMLRRLLEQARWTRAGAGAAGLDAEAWTRTSGPSRGHHAAPGGGRHGRHGAPWLGLDLGGQTQVSMHG
jgi:hypothetical protein